jgi:hypothetical protein
MGKKRSRANLPQSTSKRDTIEFEIERLSRAPFRDALTDLMEAKPPIEDLKKFSSKSPDRWSQAAAIMGRLSGYTEKLQIDVDQNIYVWIQNASDAELLAKIRELENAIEILPEKPVKERLSAPAKDKE